MSSVNSNALPGVSPMLNHSTVGKVNSCALESRNGAAGHATFGHVPFVTHFPSVFGSNGGAGDPTSTAGNGAGGSNKGNPQQGGIFSKKDDPFNEDFFNMLNSSAGPDAPGQQQTQIDSFWCR